MKLAYGMDIDSLDNKYIRLSRDAFEAASLTRVPGAFWVEFIPSLKYIPDWVPFVPFKIHAKRGKDLWTRMRDEPFDFAKQNMVCNVFFGELNWINVPYCRR